MNIQVTVQVWHKESWYIAKCPELDFVSQGRTKEEAKSNLMEVIDIQFEEMAEIGTLYEYLEECLGSAGIGKTPLGMLALSPKPRRQGGKSHVNDTQILFPRTES